LLVCEDEKTLNDGVFNPNPDKYKTYLETPGSTDVPDLIASRHRLKRNETKAKMTDVYGNVAFADGHGEYMSRKDAQRQRYTGSPTADPAGY
jgi:prepilin-type processing-associated H-X9-DG protein